MKKFWLIGSLIFVLVGAFTLNSYMAKSRNIENALQVVNYIGDLYADKDDLNTDDVSIVQSMLNEVDNLVYFGMYKLPIEHKAENIALIEVDKLEKVIGVGVRHGGNNNKLYGVEAGNWFLEWKLQE